MLPVYLRAEKPFDYADKDHVDSLLNELAKRSKYPAVEKGSSSEERLRRGDWGVIERPEVQYAVRDLGFDAFYVKEYGHRNIAVLDPSQVKSATGNNSNYDPTNPDIRYSKSQTPAEQAEAVEAVERLVTGIKERWANAPKIIVATDMNDPRIPAEVRAEDQKQQSGGAKGEPEGFYYKGTAYLIASQIKTPEDTARVLFHEALGHYGLRGVFGDALKPVLQQIATLRRADVIAKAKSYGLDINNHEEMLQAAEEVLAEMAQTRPNIGFVKRAIAAIRTWLRQHVPGFANMKLSDAEIIRDFILPARAYVEQGAKAGKDMAGKTVFSRNEPVYTHVVVDPKSGNKVVGRYQSVDAARRGRDRLDNQHGGYRYQVKPIEASDTRYSRAPATDSEAFKKWFGDSKVVDADGKPLVVYHGTEADFSEFSLNKSGTNHFQGENALFFTSDTASASNYARNASGRNGSPSVIPVYLSLQNPRVVDMPQGDKYDAVSYYDDNISGDTFGIQADGRDGVLIKYDGGVLAVAFNPTQIKSTTGNNGQYDPANPDIRFKRAEPKEPAGLTPPEQGFLKKAQAEIQDNNNRIKQVQERIAEVTGGPVPEYTDYYQAEENRPGRIAARLHDFQEQMQAPLVARIAKSGHSLAQVEELAHAMHAIERNQAIAKINPKFDPDSAKFEGVEGSGMNTDKAAAILEKSKSDKPLQRHVDDLQKIARATLDIKLASGRITDEQYEAYTNAYDFYVPLKGDGEFGPDVKRAMGHEEREEHIIENVMRDYEQTVVTGERNLARQSLLQLILQNPDTKLWSVGITPKGRYVAGKVFSVLKGGEEIGTFTSQSQVDAFMEAKGPEAALYEVVDEQGDRVQEFAKPLQDNEVPVYVNGQRVRMQIKDATLAGQLRPMNQKQIGWFSKKFSAVNRYLSRIYTAYSPTFIVKNAMRDAMTGTITMLGNQGAAVAVKAWSNYPAALAALGQYAATGKEPNTETGRMLKEYRMSGGKTGASHMSDLEQQGKTLKRMFEDAYGAKNYMADGKPTKATLIAGRKALLGMAHVIEVMNQATENALRLSLYMTLRKHGASAGKAAQAAKNVTVNFDRKGNQTSVLGALYLFFNPAVQGTANALHAVAHGDHKKQAWVALGTLAALGMWSAGAGIDDDKDRWLGESWDNRTRSFTVTIGGHKITLPLSQEFAPFYAAGVALEEARRGAVTKTQATGRLISSFIDAYVPFKGLFNYDSDNKPLDAVTSLVPTVLRPSVEAATNRNSFGSNIVPESDFTKDRPDNLKMNRNTKGTVFDSTAQALAKGGELAGARRYENDISKVSPEMLKHWWRTYTGGLGTFVADMASLSQMVAQDPSAIELADVPVIKSFAKVTDVKPIRGRFYDVTKEARQKDTEHKAAKKAEDDDALAGMDAPLKADMRTIAKAIQHAAEVRDEIVDVGADKKLSLGEKRAKLKALELDEEAIYRDAIEALKP